MGGAGIRGNPRPDRHGEAADLAIYQFALAGVYARADLDAKVDDAMSDLHRTPDRPGGPVESCVEAVAGGGGLETVPSLEGIANDSVMLFDQCFVSSISQLSLPLRRSDDICEQDGREDGVQFGRGGRGANELSDGVEHGWLLVELQLIRTREQSDLGCTQKRREVLERLAIVLACQEQ